jgi:hypothetical protein
MKGRKVLAFKCPGSHSVRGRDFQTYEFMHFTRQVSQNVSAQTSVSKVKSQ